VPRTPQNRNAGIPFLFQGPTWSNELETNELEPNELETKRARTLTRSSDDLSPVYL